MNAKSFCFTPLLILVTAGVCLAGSWHVEQDGSGDFTTLQPAVTVAASGDTIFVGPGRYENYQRMLIGVYWYRMIAFWDDPKDLVFIGSGIGMTIVGPISYEEPGPSIDLYSGIHSANGANRISISGFSFENLNLCINSQTDVVVSDSAFEKGETGIAIYTGTSRVESCSFVDFDLAIGSESCTSVIVTDCTFQNAKPYFSNTAHGVVQNCTAIGQLAHFYNSNGEISNCIATSDEYSIVVTASTASVVEVYDNNITGGYYNLSATGVNTTVTAYNNVFDGARWQNVNLRSNASLLAYGNDIYRSYTSAFMVKTENYTVGNTAIVDMSNNHWGDHSDPDILAWLIYDSGEDPNIHMTVDYLPIEGAPVPTESTSWGSVKAMFR